MRFKVPQFIDIEDKIFGPLTFKQFIYLAGGAGICYLALKLLPFFFGAMIAIPIAGLSLALAFYKFNEKPFINAVEAFLTYHAKSKLYLWQKQNAKKEESDTLKVDRTKHPELTESKLKTLSWSLDVIDTKK